MLRLFCNRFKGHSISDAAPYRSKEELERIMKLDPILSFKDLLQKKCGFTEKMFQEKSEEIKKRVIEAVERADKEKFPSLDTLEEGVLVDW